jgi:hypothetical protein
MEQHFEAKLDNLSKIISVIVAGGVVATTVYITMLALQEGHPEMILAPAGAIIALGIAAVYSVKRYTLTDSDLVIERRGSNRLVPLGDIEKAEAVTSKDLGLGVRTFGSGGFMGYLGRHIYRHIGKATLYVTDRERMILITLRSGKQVIISPEDTPGFMKALGAALKGKRPS